jgi:Mg-chelatase subunit ChlD
MSYYHSRSDELKINRLPSGLFFRVDQAEQLVQPPLMRSKDVGQSGISHYEVNYNNFVVPQYRSTKNGNELYIPLLEVSVEVEVVATIAWTKLIQTFKNQATHPIKEATYCFPLYDKSTVTAFTCTIGSDKVLKGVVKPKPQAKAEFKEAIARQQVAALLEEHTPEVFETSVGNIPAQTTIKIEICYITELKADLSGDGILVTIPTSVAPRYGTPPSSISSLGSSRSLAIPTENGLQIQIQVLLPVAISKIESRTHPVSVEMGSHGHTTTRNIRDLSAKQESSVFDPRIARATLSDRSASLGKDFVLLVQSKGGQLLASRALIEPHSKIPNSALMVSINLRDIYIPNVISPKESSEIIFLADRSGSMQDKIEALKTAMRFFLKSLPNNCSFNICSFGSNHTLMWPESRHYDQQNVDEALSYITRHFAADMGGTEILSGLQHVIQKSSLSVNTEIIILTDGEVWNSNDIFEFIRETRSSGPKEKTRFFCLGIGEAVSHYLVSGIGRHGGGLAEVVPVDSAGDWMQKVIGMLGAALTPSSWNIEIILDDVSTSDKRSETGVCIQAPYHIPEFHAFSRGSVYFLFNQELSTKVVKVKATAVASGESVIAELPIEKLETRRTCVHLLAAKAVLGDLESGQSWLHDTNSNDSNANIKAGVGDRARTEGERIGVEWRLSSKWTSFIVVDDGSSLEKPSRWYRAERSDLAELTRPRFGAANYDSDLDLDLAELPQHRYDAPSSRRMGSELSSLHSSSFHLPRLSSPLTFLSPYSLSRDSLPASSAEFGAPKGKGKGFWPRNPATSGTYTQGAAPSTGSSQHTEEEARLDSPDRWETFHPAPQCSVNAPRPPLRAAIRTAPLAISESLTDNWIGTANSIRPRPSSFQSGSQIDSAPLSSPASPIQDLTLGVLLDSSAATGAFILSPELRTALKAKFKPSMRKSIDYWSPKALREGAKAWDMDGILDTAMSVVYIEEAFTSDKKLWSLVVQKARAWLKRCLVERKDRKSLFAMLKKELWDGPKDINAKTERYAGMAGHSSMANVEGEARDVLPSDEAPGENSTDSLSKKLVVERDSLDVPKQVEGKGGEDPKRWDGVTKRFMRKSVTNFFSFRKKK